MRRFDGDAEVRESGLLDFLKGDIEYWWSREGVGSDLLRWFDWFGDFAKGDGDVFLDF